MLSWAATAANMAVKAMTAAEKRSMTILQESLKEEGRGEGPVKKNTKLRKSKAAGRPVILPSAAVSRPVSQLKLFLGINLDEPNGDGLRLGIKATSTLQQSILRRIFAYHKDNRNPNH
jgi:hypothetical protein